MDKRKYTCYAYADDAYDVEKEDLYYFILINLYFSIFTIHYM